MYEKLMTNQRYERVYAIESLIVERRKRECWFNKQRTVFFLQNEWQNRRKERDRKYSNRNITMTFEAITTEQKMPFFRPKTAHIKHRSVCTVILNELHCKYQVLRIKRIFFVQVAKRALSTQNIEQAWFQWIAWRNE